MLLGDGPLKSELRSLISKLSLGDYVRLPGFKQIEELPAYYGLAEVFIHASSTEQWGLVVNEAMAAGLPVLVSERCGCAADLVREGTNGFSFDPHDVTQMADLLKRLADMDPGRRAELGASSETIIGDWGAERFAAGMDACVRKAHEVGPHATGVFERQLLQVLLAR